VLPTVADDQLILTTTLEPAQSTQVYARLSGVVQHVTVQEGDTVTAGDTLAVLDNTELRLIERSARISYQKAQTQLSRAEQLHAKGGISTQTLESLRYDAGIARIRWQRASLDLDRATILAPRGGVVSERHIHPGDQTTSGLLLFTIIAPDDLKAELFVPADQLNAIHPGLPVTASPVADSTQTIHGTIVHISPVINPQSGTSRALATFPDAGRTIKPGTVARVYLQE